MNCLNIQELEHRQAPRALAPASEDERRIHEDVTVRAMNSVDEWGASDHCRLLIEIADGATPAVDS